MATVIGGEIEIDPEVAALGEGLPLAEALGLPEGRTTWFGAAREAVRWWLDHLAPPGPALLPAYCCESVVQPYREAGREVRFYPVGRDLGVDSRQVRALAAGCSSIQAVHYFGFPANPELFDLGLPVLEDAVQALLSPWAFARGRWAIASLRKFLAVPDGALLLAREPLGPPAIPEVSLEPASPYGRKLAARRAKFKAIGLQNSGAWWEACRRLEETERELDGPIEPHAMSSWSLAASCGLDLGGMASRRRANFLVLLELVGDPLSGVRPLFETLPPDVVPYGFPVICEDRDALKAHLADRDIYTVIHWELPAAITRDEFPDAWWLYDRILTLPLDHRYGPANLETVARAIGEFKPA